MDYFDDGFLFYNQFFYEKELKKSLSKRICHDSWSYVKKNQQ